jgi:hypothetical protein
MINNNDKHDKFIKELVQKSGMEQPSRDFTSRVMERIEIQKAGAFSIFSPMVLISSGVALVTLILVLIFIDIPFDYEIFSLTYLSNIKFNTIITDDLLDSFVSLFSGLNLSTISLFAGFSILSLVIIDRIIKISTFRSNINLYL